MVGEASLIRSGSITSVPTACGVVLIVHIVLVLKVLHRGWRAIQDGHARTTPGKAVGYLFVLQCILVLASLGLKYVPVAGFVNSLVLVILFLVASWKITAAVNEAHYYITQRQATAEAARPYNPNPAEHPESDYAPPGYYD